MPRGNSKIGVFPGESPHITYTRRLREPALGTPHYKRGVRAGYRGRGRSGRAALKMTPSASPSGSVTKSAWSPIAAPAQLPRNPRRHPERRRPSAAGGISRTTTQMAKARAAGDLSLRLRPGCAQDDAFCVAAGDRRQVRVVPVYRMHFARKACPERSRRGRIFPSSHEHNLVTPDNRMLQELLVITVGIVHAIVRPAAFFSRQRRPRHQQSRQLQIPRLVGSPRFWMS